MQRRQKTHINLKYLQSSNKCKTTWDIIKELSSEQHSKADIYALLIDSTHLKDQQYTADALSN